MAWLPSIIDNVLCHCLLHIYLLYCWVNVPANLQQVRISLYHSRCICQLNTLESWSGSVCAGRNNYCCRSTTFRSEKKLIDLTLAHRKHTHCVHFKPVINNTIRTQRGKLLLITLKVFFPQLQMPYPWNENKKMLAMPSRSDQIRSDQCVGEETVL